VSQSTLESTNSMASATTSAAPETAATTTPTAKYIKWFSEIGIEDVPSVGGKNASLGEMYQQLTSHGISVPNGFAITASAYRLLVSEGDLGKRIHAALDGLDVTNTKKLQQRGEYVRELILAADFPAVLKQQIAEQYHELEKVHGDSCSVAVRSSATAEDLPDASFAGQQETFLNVRGLSSLLRSCQKCMASLFTNRAIAYRVHKGFDHFSVALSVCIQLMVRSDQACSGVIFTLDTESGFRDVVLVTGSWGLGENVVQGAVNPDEFLIFKPTLAKGFKPIIHRKIGSKELTMTYHPTRKVKNHFTEKSKRERFCLSDEEVMQLAKWACIIEEHYTTKRGTFTPMDIEWAKDGLTEKMYIVQARPETVQSQRDTSKLVTFEMVGQVPEEDVLSKGCSVGTAIGQGTAKVLRAITDMNRFRAGEVLITEMTDPDWEPIIKQASAVVTNRGGRTCHAAIISRELGIPCIVGTGDATEKVTSGEPVTVDCSSGETGVVYKGNHKFKVMEMDVGKIERLPGTKICMNLANPDLAFQKSFIPNDGVGLARMEFIVSNHICAHPMALLDPSKLEPSVQAQLMELTRGYRSGAEYFIRKLAQGIGMIASAFYPKQVILRFSDFKTDEYANLLGGKTFEPLEDNPMIGWRGASRYYDPAYRDAFALECSAVKVVREEFGLTNLHVMIPFVRTVDEAKRVVAEMRRNGLEQGKEDTALKVMGMCEIPANVILADQFLDVLDGFSIGSNDLTQLVLGLDRNSAIVSHLFDERNEAVKMLISQVIKVCRRRHKYISICGQAPSDHPEFADFLVDEGIEAMSLIPDTVIATTVRLARRAAFHTPLTSPIPTPVVTPVPSPSPVHHK